MATSPTAATSQSTPCGLQARLGAHLVDSHAPASGVSFTVDELAGNGAGVAHAAALQTMLELAGYLAVLPALGVTEHAVTHTISTQFIAAARLGERVTVQGSLDRRTRTTAFVSVLATVDERAVARAQLTKSVIEVR